MKRLVALSGLIGLVAFAFTACGGGGGGSSTPQPPTITTPTAPTTSVSQSVSLTTTGSQTAAYALTGLSLSATFPAASTATTLTSTFSTTQPGGTPSIQKVKRRPQSIGASPIGAIAFLCVTPAFTTQLSTYPNFVLNDPAVTAGVAYVAFADPTNPSAGWTTVEGPASGSSSALAFSAAGLGPTLPAGQTSCFLFFTVASALPTPTPIPSPTPPASQTIVTSISTTSTQSVSYAIQNYADTTIFPSGSVNTLIGTTFTTTLPSGMPAVQALRLPSQDISSSAVAADAYLCVTPVQTVTLSAWPSFSFTVPSSVAGAGSSSYVAIYNPIAAVWSEIEGPAAVSGSVFAFSNTSPGPTLLSGQMYCFGLVTTPAPLPVPSTAVMTSAGVPAWTPTQHRGYIAAEYGGGFPQYIAIYAPGQIVASTTITYSGCCINEVEFDSQGNLFAAAGNDGMFEYAPGATSPTTIFAGLGGTALAIDAQNTIAVGGRSSTVTVYPLESKAAAYAVPGAPDHGGSLAIGPSGELAVPQADGTVQTFPRGATTPNRTLAGNYLFSSVNYAVVSYDGLGNLAVGSDALGTISVFAPGASTPAYTISGLTETQSMTYDTANRLVVGDNHSIDIFAAGGATLVATIPNNRPVVLATNPFGDIALAGFGLGSVVYQANAHNAVLGNLFQNGSIAISP